MSCFTPDGVQMPPNEPANEGTDRIRAWSAGMLAAFNAGFRLEVDEEERLGDDWALERGIYWIASTEKTDEEAAGWRRGGGRSFCHSSDPRLP